MASRRLSFSRPELPALMALGLAAAALWLFIALAEEMREGGTKAVDARLLMALRDPLNSALPWGLPWVQEMARDFTALGSVGVLGFVTLASVGYLILDRKRYAAAAVFVAVTGGLLLSTLLKMGFDRARPDLVPHGSVVYTASFPSGHSMMAAVTYLTLGALLAGTQARLKIKLYFLSLALLLTLLVGISRVYLGVHWPSDVLGGWAVGAAWAALCWLVFHYLQRRGKVEAETR